MLPIISTYMFNKKKTVIIYQSLCIALPGAELPAIWNSSKFLPPVYFIPEILPWLGVLFFKIFIMQ